MKGVPRQAVARGCGRARWQVAEWNEPGKRFYERIGADADSSSIDYSLSPEVVRRPATDEDQSVSR